MQSIIILPAVFSQRQRFCIMPRPLKEKAISPRCKTCGRDTARLGKLPRIGLRPLVHVYKCAACNEIVSVEPDPQEATGPASFFTA